VTAAGLPTGHGIHAVNDFGGLSEDIFIPPQRGTFRRRLRPLGRPARRYSSGSADPDAGRERLQNSNSPDLIPSTTATPRRASPIHLDQSLS
jgi:hypothetical protein